MRLEFPQRLYVPVLVAVTLITPCAACAESYPGREKLQAHGEEQFRKEIIHVTDAVYVAVGYSASNVTLIQGDVGSVIVDTGSNPTEAGLARAAFGDLLTSVHAIIYTHGHPDHTGGATVFAGNDDPEIHSHELLVEGAQEVARGSRGGGDQFGMALPESLYINAGIQLQYGRDSPPTREGYLPPTHTFDGQQLTLTIAGLRLELIHTPGETRENTAVWLPDKSVLMPGDDFYRAFPNLYPVRGTRLRPPELWVASLNRMIELEAEYLVPGHMRPIIGADNVRSALVAYRDGISSIYNQTIEGIKKGMRPDELVEAVQLPPHLRDSPYLQEYYGDVAWSVRAIYSDAVGWFDGNATNMFPLSQNERAERIIDLGGGISRILSRANAALDAEEFQWAAELSDHVLEVDDTSVDAKRIKARALTELGERQVNATARNYYLSSAQYLLQDLSQK